MWIFKFSLGVCSTELHSLVSSLENLVSNGRQVLLGGIRLGGSATPGRCTATPMAVTTPRQKPPLAAFSILDSIHKQSNTTLQAMLTLKVFSQKHVKAKLAFLKMFSINIFRLLSEVH